MLEKHIYLKIERIENYNPVEPEPADTTTRKYKRDCMYNVTTTKDLSDPPKSYTINHRNGLIPDHDPNEVKDRSLEAAIVYREYLNANYTIPKIDKLIFNDINEPNYNRRVPGAVVYTHPNTKLIVHVFNSDNKPHSFHVHGLSYGIDSDGAWPFGIKSKDGRRSDKICHGEYWNYTFDITQKMVGAWPFHEHYQAIEDNVKSGLFGGIIVIDSNELLPPSLEISKEIMEKYDKPSLTKDEYNSLNNEMLALEKEFLLKYDITSDKHNVGNRDSMPVIHVPLFYHGMDGATLSTDCFNGRGYVGNSPTIIAWTGQKIKWYVFSLALDTEWHNFHPHSQRWSFANKTMDVRSISPAESFIVDTTVPPVLLLSEEIKRQSDKTPNAKKYTFRGDFLFHCHIEMHMMNGMVGIMRSRQQVWLTKEQFEKIQDEKGIFQLDSNDNDCPQIGNDHCEDTQMPDHMNH
ncbi:MAG: multicopper oxidase domain-containing protein [Candidatus Nitrosocosmicus sp.]